jgi:hypothetical protein
VGDVGTLYYVQMVNSAFAVYDKVTGATVQAPTQINQLWISAGADVSDRCRSNNDGDPIVLYDRLAGRWFLSQFYIQGSLYGVCLAVSQTADPTGSYYLYTVSLPNFPDYPKFGVWPNAYLMSTNELPTTYAAYAFDRPAMLVGDSLSGIGLNGSSNFLLPADVDGPLPPPASSPPLFYTFKDNTFHGAEGTGTGDRLEIYEFTADFDTLANSSFTLTQVIPVASFNYTVCGYFNLDCVPQTSTSSGLDPVSEWPMHRLQYRNFGGYETLVGNFTVDASGSNDAGIRWFELNRPTPGTGNWVLQQEATHAPDGSSRFMGSIAMDGFGNIALGYSTSSASMHPALRYAARTPGDTLGTFRMEQSLIEGTGSQTGTGNRWGDYSSLNVDPLDDRTFWYTGEYYATTGSFNWRTRIGRFRVERNLLVETSLYLEGSFASGTMRTALSTANVVPETHPYGVLPWSFSGADSVVAVADSVVDWVLLSLLKGDPLSPPMTLVAQRAGLLGASGRVVDTTGSGPVAFEVDPDSAYYLVVSHRNHLPVMSSGSLSVSGDTASWDFRFADSLAYSAGGEAMVPLAGGVFGLPACDIDADGQILANDFNDWLTDTKSVSEGYLPTDCNLDGQVTALDFNLWLINTKAARSSQVPAFSGKP